MNDQIIEQEIQAKGLTAPRITPADIEANIASEHYFTAADAVAPPVSKMVDRFLGWTLPEDFCPDCFIRFDRDAAQANQDWPIGTNLLHAGQAKEMFEHAIGKPEVPQALNLLTFCVLVLRNGFTVTGESACASPENFDAEIGRKIARQNAVAKIWPLMGYALKEHLAARDAAANRQIKLGDTVRLKSGGPDMEVTAIIGGVGGYEVFCVWDSDLPNSGKHGFPMEALELVGD